MSIPIILPYGYIAVYGLGTVVGANNPNLSTDNTIFRFATIYAIGVNMSSVNIGQSVLFNSTDEVCRLAINNYPYPVLPTTKIIGTETSAP